MYVYGDNGVLSTYPEDTPTGRVELPMLRAAAGVPAPCHVCPKVPADAPEKSPAYAAEFEPWVVDALDWYDGCKAVGDFDRPDPFMRAAAAVIAAARERPDPAELVAVTLAALLKRR